MFEKIKKYVFWLWKNPKEIRKEYDDEINRIEDYRKRKNSKYKIPGCPWAYYCVAEVDHSKYQWWNLDNK